jgi:hypothetical protein
MRDEHESTRVGVHTYRIGLRAIRIHNRHYSMHDRRGTAGQCSIARV